MSARRFRPAASRPMIASFAINRSRWSRARKTYLHLLHGHDAANRLRRFLGREQQQGGIALDLALGHGHIENLLQIPPQMIDDRKRQPSLRLRVEQILKLVAPEAGKLPVPEYAVTRWTETLFTLFSRVECFHFRL